MVEKRYPVRKISALANPIYSVIFRASIFHPLTLAIFIIYLYLYVFYVCLVTIIKDLYYIRIDYIRFMHTQFTYSLGSRLRFFICSERFVS